MEASKTRKPCPGAANTGSRANTKNSTAIITEILGTVLAALIFAASIWSSVFGMSGGFDHQEAIVMAEVVDGR